MDEKLDVLVKVNDMAVNMNGLTAFYIWCMRESGQIMLV